jgi:type III secretion protein V
MSAGEAAGTYSILSIGDGLVTQIPSLLVSVAAGIVVTRVGGGADMSGLGVSIARDLSRNRAAFISTGVMLALISLAPGLPSAPFLLIGISAFAYGIARPDKDGTAGHPGDPTVSGRPDNPAVRISDPLLLEMDRPLLPDAAAHDGLKTGIEEIKRRVSDRYGIKVPGIGVAVSDFGDGRIAARLRGAPLFSISFNGRTGLFILRKRPSVEGIKFLPGPDESILAFAPEPLHTALQKEGARKIAPRDYALAAFEGSIVRHLPDLVGIQEAHEMLEELQLRSPILIRETVPRILPYPKLVEVLKRLLEECVPVTDLRAILETAAACGPGEGVGPLVEAVRGTLRRTICDSVRGPSETLDVVLADRTLEAAMSDGICSADGSQPPAVSPETAKAIIMSIKLAAVGCNGRDAHALVTDSRYRRRLRKIIEYEMPGLCVLSYQELVPGMDIRPVGRAVLPA